MMYYLNKVTGYVTGYAAKMYRIFGDETEKTKEIVLNKKSLKNEENETCYGIARILIRMR